VYGCIQDEEERRRADREADVEQQRSSNVEVELTDIQPSHQVAPSINSSNELDVSLASSTHVLHSKD